MKSPSAFHLKLGHEWPVQTDRRDNEIKARKPIAITLAGRRWVSWTDGAATFTKARPRSSVKVPAPQCVGEIIICVREPQHVAHDALPNYDI
jgi:hypothetical protein